MDKLDKLKKSGLKLTPQRKLVYETIMKLKHASIDQIITEMKKDNHVFALSTVYRIIESFLDVGIVSQISSPNTGKTYYEISTIEHHHLFNGKEILDYNDPELTEIIKQYLNNKSIHLSKDYKVIVQIVNEDLDTD